MYEKYFTQGEHTTCIQKMLPLLLLSVLLFWLLFLLLQLPPAQQTGDKSLDLLKKNHQFCIHL